MDIEIFTLCEAATENAGKLNILGAFDRILAHKLPAMHPHCAIALRVRFDRIEEGPHQVKINLVDEDGKAVFPGLTGNINIKLSPDGQSVCANLILNLNGLKFERAGQHAIDLAIDGRHEKSLPVSIVMLPAPPAQPNSGKEGAK